MNEEYLGEIQAGNPQHEQCHITTPKSLHHIVTHHLFNENLQSLNIIYYQMLIKQYELQKVHELNPAHLKAHLQRIIYN
jgi:hypothetical protein